MIRDHKRLIQFLHDLENNIGKYLDIIDNYFNSLKWKIEKHYFIEERPLFVSYNPNKPVKDYSYFSGLMDQHQEILNLLNS
jgi:hypothetical protein